MAISRRGRAGDRRERSDEACQDALEHEGPAHVPVRRADELHHLDLAPASEDREADRVRDEDRRGREEDDDGDEEDDLDGPRDLRGCAAKPPCRSAPGRRPASFAFWTAIAIASVSSPRLGTMSNDAGSGFEARFSVSSGLRFRMIASACSFEMNVIPPGLTRGSDSRKHAELVDLLRPSPRPAMNTCTASSRFLSSDHETSHVPSPMKTPMRNIPMSTESAEATVVETFAPIERSASAKSVRRRVIPRRTLHAARRARACPPRAR